MHTHTFCMHLLFPFLFCLFSLSFILSPCVCLSVWVCCVMLEGSMCLFDRAAGPARQSKDAIQTQTGSQRGKEIETWVVAGVCVRMCCVCVCVCVRCHSCQHQSQRELKCFWISFKENFSDGTETFTVFCVLTFHFHDTFAEVQTWTNSLRLNYFLFRNYNHSILFMYLF